ncbi:mRNA-degrading endonuclease RelE of RelBE toxin-antitoxin system [Breoghania corrubedonensis]|uniref:mRNA-degrading endonuclease RelE of RelBE toxin-antitoxin system n=1 Tax=Breoghania corrubedonensis TaxID=665038 RepID=A0A2T5UQ16_9HYPH|nr:cytotoxic translational repressor of toxin-antitoxin stability system [Breoghania corrubedonensis]PTW53599.1 mRNA-degrading endonuclease RelE of RelBE toxin-antitoxin system [Breoghania corrubedonensis]
MKKVIFEKAANDALWKMPRNYARLIHKKIYQYAEGEGAQVNNTKRMKGSRTVRLRVGDWRVFITETQATVEVTDIDIRGEAYKRKGKHK